MVWTLIFPKTLTTIQMLQNLNYCIFFRTQKNCFRIIIEQEHCYPKTIQSQAVAVMDKHKHSEKSMSLLTIKLSKQPDKNPMKRLESKAHRLLRKLKLKVSAYEYKMTLLWSHCLDLLWLMYSSNFGGGMQTIQYSILKSCHTYLKFSQQF